MLSPLRHRKGHCRPPDPGSGGHVATFGRESFPLSPRGASPPLCFGACYTGRRFPRRPLGSSSWMEPPLEAYAGQFRHAHRAIGS
eukprot:11161674-Lingulodinium_polyedra.AAC.1